MKTVNIRFFRENQAGFEPPKQSSFLSPFFTPDTQEKNAVLQDFCSRLPARFPAGVQGGKGGDFGRDKDAGK